MKLIESIKDTFGGSKSKGGDWDEEFQEGIETEDDWEEEDIEEEEPMQEEWDSAYRFAEDMLEEDGFADMNEFIQKAIMYKVNRSPLFRDRIKSGTETMTMVTSSMQEVQSLRNEMKGKKDRNYGEMANKLRDANETINQMDKLAGKEDEIVNSVLSMGHELVGAMKSQNVERAGNVRSTMETREER